MTGIHSRALKFSLSAALVLALMLLVGLMCVPAQLRAAAASHVMSVAGNFNVALVEAWHLAFRIRESDHSVRTPTNHESSPRHSVAQPVSAQAETLPSATAAASSISMHGFGAGSFNTVHGAGSSPDSMAALLSEILKDHNSELGVDAGLETLAANQMGTGGALNRLGSTGNYSSAGTSAGVIAPTGVSRLGPMPTHDQNKEGMLGPASVNPSARNAYADAHQGRVRDLESGLGSGFDVASSPQGNQVQSSDVASPEPGYVPPMAGSISDGSGASHDRGKVDPTAIEPTKHLLSELNHLVQGEDHHGFVVQNGGGDGASSGSGDAPVPTFTDSPGDGSHQEDHGSTEEPNHRPDPDPGFLASVPEPGSLMLLSLALGTVILWRRFRSVH